MIKNDEVENTSLVLIKKVQYHNGISWNDVYVKNDSLKNCEYCKFHSTFSTFRKG